jgi:hypothetical protein
MSTRIKDDRTNTLGITLPGRPAASEEIVYPAPQGGCHLSRACCDVSRESNQKTIKVQVVPPAMV